MKNDKFCFNKSVGVIVVVVVMLGLFALVASQFTNQSTSTNTRADFRNQEAAISCSFDQTCAYKDDKNVKYPKKVCLKDNSGNGVCSAEYKELKFSNPKCSEEDIAEEKRKGGVGCDLGGFYENYHFYLTAQSEFQADKYISLKNSDAVAQAKMIALQRTGRDFPVDNQYLERKIINIANLKELPIKLRVSMGANLFGYKTVQVMVDCDANKNNKYKRDPALYGEGKQNFLEAAKQFPMNGTNTINTTLVFASDYEVDRTQRGKIVRPWDYRSEDDKEKVFNSDGVLCTYDQTGEHLIMARAIVQTIQQEGMKEYIRTIPMYINIVNSPTQN